MKVICIDGVKKGDLPKIGHPANTNEVVIEGNEYDTVWAGIILNTPAYKLAGKPPKTHYRQSKFIPLSSIDETEMIREKLDVIINEVKI